MSIEKLRNHIKEKKGVIKLALGKFSELKEIGQGGNGLVYSANYCGHEVALKVLVNKFKGNSGKTKINRFLAEYFNILLIKENKGLVRYFNYDTLIVEQEQEYFNYPVIVMKLYKGSLASIDSEKTKSDLEELFEFLITTVGMLHNSGVVHRDLKPENILFDDDGYVLADFGIASYNPNMFKVGGKTKRTERIANRLFSAPEQELGGTTAHQTMDIYAIGQILQWYATGQTHRGTDRKKISTVFEDVKIIDEVVERCLNHDPSNRFQSINEISFFVKTSNEIQEDPYKYLSTLNELGRRNFPNNPYGIAYTNDVKKIDRLLTDLNSNKIHFENNIVCISSLGWDNLELENKGEGIWLISQTKFKVTEVYFQYSPSNHSDFIILKYEPGKPYIIDGKEVWETVIVDGKTHISLTEFENSYAEIDDKIIKLSEHKVESKSINNKKGYMLICTRYSNVWQPASSKQLDRFFELINETETHNEIIKAIKQLKNETRTNKHPLVYELS